MFEDAIIAALLKSIVCADVKPTLAVKRIRKIVLRKMYLFMISAINF
jgi:hypothetical protein